MMKSGQHSTQKKIFLSPDRKLAYCASGNEIANTVGKRLLQTLRSDGPHDFEQALRSQIQEEISAQLMSSTIYTGSILLGRFVGNGAQIWKIVVHNQPTMRPEILRVQDRVCEGDKANPASFIGEAYFPKDYLEVPIARLRLLAAHSVLMAGKINPQYIDGLDMAESDRSGFRKLAQSEIASLMALSRDLDTKTREGLLGKMKRG